MLGQGLWQVGWGRGRGVIILVVYSANSSKHAPLTSLPVHVYACLQLQSCTDSETHPFFLFHGCEMYWYMYYLNYNLREESTNINNILFVVDYNDIVKCQFNVMFAGCALIWKLHYSYMHSCKRITFSVYDIWRK